MEAADARPWMRPTVTGERVLSEMITGWGLVFLTDERYLQQGDLSITCDEDRTEARSEGNYARVETC